MAVAPRKACFYYEEQHDAEFQHKGTNEYHDTTDYKEHLEMMINVQGFSLDSPPVTRPNLFAGDSTASS